MVRRKWSPKGIALGAAVYEDPALRIMGDIDLCVRDAERQRAESAVAEIRDELVRANPDRRSQSGFQGARVRQALAEREAP
jgi:hypothetical protein